jgi:hypothetical protein
MGVRSPPVVEFLRLNTPSGSTLSGFGIGLYFQYDGTYQFYYHANHSVD